MTKKRILPSVRKVARRLAHLQRQGATALDYDGNPVVTLYVKQGFYFHRGWNCSGGWGVNWEKAPLNYERQFRTAYSTAVLKEGDDVEKTARELLEDIRWDAERRSVWVTPGETPDEP